MTQPEHLDDIPDDTSYEDEPIDDSAFVGLDVAVEHALYLGEDPFADTIYEAREP